VVGGLLSTYDLSGDNIFLEKARDIADRLLPAWDTPSGIPYNIIDLARGNAHNPGWTGGDSILADSGTEQLEFIALSQRTGDPKYQEKVEKAIVALNKTFPADGLVPIYVNPNDGTAYGTITFGAMGDRDMWETSMKGLVSLIRRSSPSSFAYICEKTRETLTDKMDELACFAPGMLALGSSGYGKVEAKKILSLAEELAWTCYNFYQSTQTKLAGENYLFNPGRDYTHVLMSGYASDIDFMHKYFKKCKELKQHRIVKLYDDNLKRNLLQDMSVGTTWNILRPETVESLFYLWRLTGNVTYQEWGWNIFQAFEKNCRIESGYVGLT
ncbi:hypothetical protein Gohar_025786, partial [Gossypium harknessii]|nr:hypothetical protein [Gossypium harknessii]